MLNLLLVEDQHLLRQGLKMMLEADSRLAVVAEAENGREALQQLSALNCDAIIMDLSLPDMDGLDCIRAIRAARYTVPILVVTMHQADHIVQQAMTIGAQGYVLKSAYRDDLLAALFTVCEGGTYIQSGLCVSGVAPVKASSSVELSLSEKAVLNRAVRKISPDQIRHQQGLSERSFSSLLRSIFRKLSVTTLEQAVQVSVQSGYILPDPHG